MACDLLEFRILWWAQVTVTPEDKRIAVLRRGISNGLNGLIPIGGHIIPISTTGAKLLWKKAQKKDTKKSTSEAINKIMPHRIPRVTLYVWRPWKVASREISRHHCHIVRSIRVNPKRRSKILFWWNHFTIPEVKVRALMAPVNGHGLWSTRWKVWNPCFFIN